MESWADHPLEACVVKSALIMLLQRCSVLSRLLLLLSLAATSGVVSAEEAAESPPCIEVYSANPEQPCPRWSSGEYNIAVGRTSLKKPVWHNSGNSDALFRWHPRNGWIIAKLKDSTGMSYRCLKGSGVDASPLGCDSFAHPDDVCKVRACGTAPSTPEVGDGTGKEL